MLDLERLIAIFAPHACFGCGMEGSVLCVECRDSVVRHPEICYRCHKLSTGFKTCSNCHKYSPLRSVFIVAQYEGPVELAMRALKFNRARAASQPLAQLISDNFYLGQFNFICAVPSATRHQLQRGYNPAELIGQNVARLGHLPYRQVLARIGQKRQVGASRQQRIHQLKGAFYVRQKKSIIGQRVLLIDDILTTGATLSECAKVLKSAGAKSVDAMVVARNVS